MRYVIAMVCLFVAAGLTVQAGAIEAKKLVGTWETGKDKDVVKATFTKGGKLHIVHTIDGTEHKMDGTYKVKDDKITVTFEKDGKTETKMGTIEKLTADVLVIQPAEEKGKKMEFKRVK
ncbi:MAG: DUF5640 domain-containing protein [Gemmataceae bacterium]